MSDPRPAISRRPSMPVGRIEPVTGVVPNPGMLASSMYLPATGQSKMPLATVLHGCTQNGSDYAAAACWIELADRRGLLLLLPQQQQSNNFNLCFNWFERGDYATRSGQGGVDHGHDRPCHGNPCPRSKQCLHHRTFGRCRDGGDHARLLSGNFCRRRFDSWPSARRRQFDVERISTDVPRPQRQRSDACGTCYGGIRPCRPLATHIYLAWKCRPDDECSQR